MKLLPLLAILLLVLPFGAQEVPLELILDELPDEYTDAVFSAWDDFKLNLSGSYILSDNPYYIAHLKADAASFRLYANLKTEADDSWNNFQISYRKGRKNSITLGNYRVKASEGLVFSQASGADLLLPPPHPRSYSPFGALINVVTGDFDVYVLASDQKRNAKLENGGITALSRIKHKSVFHTREQLLAGGLSWETPPFRLAGDIYHQAYDRAFALSNLDSLLTVCSLSLSLTNAVHRLGFQAAYATETPALAASWEMRTKSFAQSWRYTRIPRWQSPAYAAKPLKLSSLDKREEIEASIRIEPLKWITLRAGSIINRNIGDLDTAKWLAQHSIEAAYRDHETSLKLRVISIDREVLSEIDSSYLSTIPTHYRFYMDIDQKLRPYLAYRVKARYQHQNKLVKLSEASFLRNSFCYTRANLELELGLAMWLSLNQKLYIESDSDSGYEALGKDNLRLEARAGYKLPHLKLNASLEQSLQSPRSTSARLGLGLGF